MAIAQAVAGILRGVSGIVFDVLDIFGIGGKADTRRLNQQVANATIFHDMVLLKDKTEGVIFALDVYRNIRRLESLKAAVESYARSGGKTAAGYNVPLIAQLAGMMVHKPNALITDGNIVLPFRQLERLRTFPVVLSPTQALTNWNTIQSPASAQVSNVIVDARGYYAPKNQFILPSLLRGDNQETFENLDNGFVSVREFLLTTSYGQKWVAQWSREHDALDAKFRSGNILAIVTDNYKLETAWTRTSKERAFKFARFELKRGEL